MQARQAEWTYQWTQLRDNDAWLFHAWIHPQTLADFAGKTVLDAGCGPGHHVRLIAPLARRIVGVDLNTAAIARAALADLPQVTIAAGDIATWDTGERFEIVYSIGVVHHTADPEATVAHLKTLVAPGGRLILWVYAREGNTFVAWVLEPLKQSLLRFLPRRLLLLLSHGLVVIGSCLMHTVYRLPLPETFPYYAYCRHLRGSTYQRRLLNVFDKLNAPTTHLITAAQAQGWLADWRDVHVDRYVDTSWRISGTKP